MKQKSLRQLAKELGVSHSYLSQVKNGKRPASNRVVSRMVSSGQRYNFDLPLINSYNYVRLGNRLAVGRQTLDLQAVVRIHVPQPF